MEFKEWGKWVFDNIPAVWAIEVLADGMAALMCHNTCKPFPKPHCTGVLHTGKHFSVERKVYFAKDFVDPAEWVGKWCAFWDSKEKPNDNDCMYGKLLNYEPGSACPFISNGARFTQAEPVEDGAKKII